VTQNERLRALLAEARVLHGCHGVCVPECIWSRIDAALAEPSEQEETEHAMHMRVRAGYDKTIADSWRAKVAEVEKERDEARSEVERLKAVVRNLEAGITAQDQVLTDRYNAMLRERNEARAYAEDRNNEANNLQRHLNRAASERDEARAALADAYRRGAEAMREAAMGAAWHSNAMGVHNKIRALSIPEDKP
jgi:chromosome segregation ATPase